MDLMTNVGLTLARAWAKSGSEHIKQQYGDTYVTGGSFIHQGNVYNIGHAVHPGISTTAEEETASCKKLIESLRFPRMGARLLDISPAISETGQWFFREPCFKQWLNNDETANHHGFLWIKGKPGCGKSTLMKLLYDHATEKGSAQVVISYFFNGRAQNQLERSSLGLYRSLVWQILDGVPELHDFFHSTFKLKVLANVTEEWAANELKSFLLDVLPHLQNCNIEVFIDAIDEGDEDATRELVLYLEQLASHARSASLQFRICLASRHYPHIGIRRGLSFNLEDQAGHDTDIQLYTHETLRCDHTTTDLDQLRRRICHKAAGVFLWVVLVIPLLNAKLDRGGSVSAASHLLESLPAKLTDLFTQILMRSGEDLEESISLFQWVLFSTRPLKAIELYLAVQYSLPSVHGKGSELPDEHRLRQYLLHCSRGLIEISNTHAVQFIHETVRTFLSGPFGLAVLTPSLATCFTGQSHDTPKRACLAYIRRYEADNCQAYQRVMRYQKLLFLDYAVRNVFRHADTAHANAVPQHKLLRSMMKPQDLDLAAWRKCFGWIFPEERDPHELHLLYILAEADLSGLASCLVELKVDVNAADGDGRLPLHIACARGHSGIVQLLLENGADANSTGDEFPSAFVAAQHARLTERLEILDLLRQYGAVPGLTALSHAIRRSLTDRRSAGHKRITEWLNNLLDFNYQSGMRIEICKYIFIEALYDSCYKALQCAIEQEMDATTVSTGTETALHRSLDIVRRRAVCSLSQYGAKVDYDARRSLQVVASDVCFEMVKVLLNGNIDLKLEGAKRGGSLVASGKLQVAQLLLDAKTNADILSNQWRKALQAASTGHRATLVSLLWQAEKDMSVRPMLHNSSVLASIQWKGDTISGIPLQLEVHGSRD